MVLVRTHPAVCRKYHLGQRRWFAHPHSASFQHSPNDDETSESHAYDERFKQQQAGYYSVIIVEDLQRLTRFVKGYYMSTVPTQVTAELFNYLIARTTPENPFLRELREAAIEAELPAIWIAPEQAIFMGILLQLSGAKRVLEVGTGGYSAVAMAQAIGADGHVDSCEIDSGHVAFARDWIERGGLSDVIDVLKAMPSPPYLASPVVKPTTRYLSTLIKRTMRATSIKP